ncbi:MULTISPECIES: M23 family metallopeptidase [Anaerolinea]|uniref:M23 family metallopeptidase n=1 Tax=Anaerolinea TaxID=233189 RepID=UPI00261EE04F|nr:M23 family metallopeptidase [Anaerolinea thermophila]
MEKWINARLPSASLPYRIERPHLWLCLTALALILEGCVSTSKPEATSTLSSLPVSSFTATVELTPTPESAFSFPITPAAEDPSHAPETEESHLFCSPLEGIALDALQDPDLLKTPFEAPPAGDDGGHFGVDFAYWNSPEGKPMLGLPVHAILEGKVAGIISNRKPYGNTIILETPLKDLPAEIRELLPVSSFQNQPTPIPARTLFCPQISFQGDFSSLSLYHLYAHLNTPPARRTGESVMCGDKIGEVGSTGNSVNAHLHLETRIGPAGVTFPGMAHYDNSATVEEMGWYCLWRISGLFRAFDPMILFP